jgi:hypothetical protein
MSFPLLHEKVWYEKGKYDEAERLYYENLAKVRHNLASQKVQPWSETVKEIKWTSVLYSELQHTLDLTYSHFNSRILIIYS